MIYDETHLWDEDQLEPCNGYAEVVSVNPLVIRVLEEFLGQPVSQPQPRVGDILKISIVGQSQT